jgi:hypothetical protein
MLVGAIACGIALLVWLRRFGAEFASECTVESAACRGVAAVVMLSMGLLAIVLPPAAWFAGRCTVSELGIQYWSLRGKHFLSWDDVKRVVIRPAKWGAFFDIYGEGEFVRLGPFWRNELHDVLELVLHFTRPGTPVIDSWGVIRPVRYGDL